MKVKIKVQTLYVYDSRECRLIIDFNNDFDYMFNFLTVIKIHNHHMFYRYLTPRQRSRIVGVIQKIIIEKFIN